MDKLKSLTPRELEIIKNQATELAHSGEYEMFEEIGTYLCRQCGLALFRSDSKFLSGCGWPSFDTEIPNTIERRPDQDGVRTEIVCQRCKAHLGHVFIGEQLTSANQRHCVNSLSIDFVHNNSVLDTEEAIYAGGCFWGVAHLLKSMPGVLKTIVGYTGGKINGPSYEQVCRGDTEHFEAVRVIYDSNKIDFEILTKMFLEIHDPYQQDGQGADISSQYRSAIFYFDNIQKQIATDLLSILKEKSSSPPATMILPASPFWLAESAHQDYYEKSSNNHCWHKRVIRFE